MSGGDRDGVKASLRHRRTPAWWTDAKLGIFVHWTPASVPAFAPVEPGIGTLLQSDDPEALAQTPYTEWYENSLRFPDSPVSAHHRKVYGDRPYAKFAQDWEAGLESWDPESWAARFAATGARYVVFVAKHADGYCLWPTGVANPNRAGWNCERDVVGEMADAVRGAGMRFGIYYCGGFDWTFDRTPIGSMSGVLGAIPRGDYPAYAEAQVRELIARYRPSVLWNDVAWPAKAPQLRQLLAHYYRTVPDGVINDRWLPWSAALSVARTGPARRVVDAVSRRQARRDGGLIPPEPPHYDHRTPEYVAFPEIEHRPWELVRGMDRSFAYNAESRPQDFLGHEELLWLLTDVVSKGGNLLLNAGPRGVDAQIPDEQLDRLDWLGSFVGHAGTAIHGTRPWVTAGSTTPEGAELRYTTCDDRVFAFISGAASRVTLPDLRKTPATSAALLDGYVVASEGHDNGIVLTLPDAPRGPQPIVVALGGVVAATR
ncbi:MAG: alpha-L-fucosidase [Microthrixaceae bacterium]|nr:alpha-L-fucosidase [Microthrixaceae bacterium]